VKCIIAGCRYIDNYQHVLDAVQASGFSIDLVVSGKSKGIDLLGERWAEENEKPVKLFPADWKAHPRAAGPIRNRKMAEFAGALIAIWDGRSRGTKNMIQEAQKRNLQVYIHRVEQTWWVSSKRMTFNVWTVDNIIIDSAPIGKKFTGQHIIRLLKWMKKQGGLRVHKYDSE
jgi:hypothetical protein